MKVIGKTKHGFILEASVQEVARIGGFDSTRERGYKNLEIGDQLKVSEIYKQLEFLMDQEAHTGRLIRDLNAFAEMLKTIDPVIPVDEV